MGFGKRIILFLATNLLIVLTISILMSVLGVGSYLTPYGINYQQLALFCLLWGFGGAFISLGLSRIIAKWAMGVQVIDPETSDPTERWLLDTVHALARRANLGTMPQVGYYESPEVNAFATGPTKNRALVAVSSGLMEHLEQDQVTGVLGHEVAHIANGDMVTMTLVQGVVNAFVMFIARIIAFFVSQFARDEMRWIVQIGVTIALEIGLSILGMIVVSWFSRQREFRADRGGARLAGQKKMIAALQGLRSTLEIRDEEEHASLAALKISSQRGGIRRLFSTHPPLEERIQRLQDWQG